MADQYIARREGVGLGIEGTPGTGVDAQTWLRLLDNTVQNKTDSIENESSMGVVDRVNDSEVVAKRAEGQLSGKVTSLGLGFLLTGFFGSPSTGTAVSGVYPHTFTMSQSSVPAPALSITRYNPVDTQRHSYAVIDSLEFSVERGGWLQVSAAVQARAGTSVVETVALADEKEFTSKHVTVKLAANEAGLSGATALDASRATITLERQSEPYTPLGTDSAIEFDRGAFEAKGEIVIRYKDAQYETDYLANTVKALQFTAANGTDAELTFTATKVRYRELERSTDRDNVVTQTLSWAAELDTTNGRSIQAVLNNTRATYEVDA